MHRLEQLKAGKVVQDGSPVIVKKRSANSSPVVAGESALEGKIVPRKVSRTSNHRRESRHHGIADTAIVKCVEGEVEAKVVNVSEQGLLIEAPIAPGIGDKIEIKFEGCDPIKASVIWRKDHRIGLDLGQPSIDLIPQA